MATAKKEHLKFLSVLILLVGFGLSILSFWYLLPGVVKPSADLTLVWAKYGHSNLSDYLLFTLPISLSLFLKSKKNNQLFLGGLLSLLMISLILTFSRGAFLTASFVSIVIIFLIKGTSFKKRIFGCLTVFVPIVFFLLITFFSYNDFGKNAFEVNPKGWLIKQAVKPEFDSARFTYWKQAVLGFFDRPIFGWGISNFDIVGLRFQNTKDSWSKFSHNYYLQILVESGVFAFLSFVAFLTFSIIKIYNKVLKQRNNPLMIGLFGSLLATSIHSFIDYDWQYPAIFLTFLAICANLIGFQENRIRIPRKILRIMFIFSIVTFGFLLLQLRGQYYLSQKNFKKIVDWAPWFIPALSRTNNSGFADFLTDGKYSNTKIMNLTIKDPYVQKFLAEKNYSKKNYQEAVRYFENLIKLDPYSDISVYEKLINIYEKMGRTQEKERIITNFSQKISKIEKIEKFDHRFGKVFYKWGSDYYKKGDFDKTLFWWEKSADALQQWSFLYIETASLYLKLNKPNEAGRIIKKCIEFKYPKDHCKEYLVKLNKKENFELPGFWEQEILRIPDN